MNNIPRSRSVSPTRKIETKTVFQRVTTERTKEKGRVAAYSHIEGLKDNRGWFSKLFGFLVQTEEAEILNARYQRVKKDFEKYKEVGIEIPQDIVNHFEREIEKKKEAEEGGKKKVEKEEKEIFVYGSPDYINDQEAKLLQKLVDRGERRLKFREQKAEFEKQLAERHGLRIEGDLKDFFADKKLNHQEPNHQEILTYCNYLRQIMVSNNCFPDSVTSSVDPRRFEFFFGGDKPEVIVVREEKDLDKLQEMIERYNSESGKAWSREQVVGAGLDFERKNLNGADPFAREGKAEKKAVERLNELNVDMRTFWDKFRMNVLGEKTTAHVDSLLLENRQRLQDIKNEFYEAVGSDFNYVINKMPSAVQNKLDNGEPLTALEVKELQKYALEAMRYQQYKKDLIAQRPLKFEGPLALSLPEGSQFKRWEMERYLNELKLAIMKGGYPNLVTSNPEVNKFEFFNERGERKTITVSMEDNAGFINSLRELNEQLNVCVKLADKLNPHVGKAELGEKLDQRDEKLLEAKEKRKELKGELAGMESVVAALKNREQKDDQEIQKLKKEIEKGKEGRRQHMQTMEERRLENLRLQQEQEVLQKVSNEAYVQLEKEYKDLDKLYEEKLGENDSLGKEVDDLSVKMTQVEAQNKVLQKELEQVKAINEELKLAKEVEVQKREGLEAENKQLKKGLEEVGQELLDLKGNDESERLKEENQDLQKQVNQMKADYRKLEEDNKFLEEKKKDFDEQLDREAKASGTIAAQYFDEIKEQRLKIEELEKQLAKARGQGQK